MSNFATIEAQREALVDGLDAEGNRMTRPERIAAEARIESSQTLVSRDVMHRFEALADASGTIVAAKRVRGRYGLVWAHPKGYWSDAKAAKLGLHRVTILDRATRTADGRLVQQGYPTPNAVRA